MRRRVLLALLFTGVSAPAPAQPPAPASASLPAGHDPAAGDTLATMGVHGMLVVGGGADGRVLLSHLPLYRAPHDRQLLLVARLRPSAPAAVGVAPGPSTPGPAALYAADRRASGERVYTIEPERMPLARVAHAHGWAAPPDAVGPAAAPVAFRATLYRGHFERGGAAIARDVTVEVERVLVSRTLGTTPAEDAARADGALHGYLIPLGGETFFVHRVGAAPSYDQVVALAPAPRVGGAAVVAVRVAGRPDARVLREGDTVRLVPTAARGIAAPPLRATVARQLYLEFDDLARPAGAAR